MKLTTIFLIILSLVFINIPTYSYGESPDCDGDIPAEETSDWSLHYPEPSEHVVSDNGGKYKFHNDGPGTVRVEYTGKDPFGNPKVKTVDLPPNSSTFVNGNPDTQIKVYLMTEEECTTSTGSVDEWTGSDTPPSDASDWSLHAPSPTQHVVAPEGGDFAIHNDGPGKISVTYTVMDSFGNPMQKTATVPPNCTYNVSGEESYPITIDLLSDVDCTTSTGTATAKKS